MSDYDKETHLEEPKYDEGTELPIGFSSWYDVYKYADSSRDVKLNIEGLMEILKTT